MDKYSKALYDEATQLERESWLAAVEKVKANHPINLLALIVLEEVVALATERKEEA